MATNAVAGPSSKPSAPLTKNAKRRLKKKQQQQQQQQRQAQQLEQPSASSTIKKEATDDDDDANEDEDGYAQAGPSCIIDEAASIHIDPDSQTYAAFSNVLWRYQPSTLAAQQQPSKGVVLYSDDEVGSDHSDSDQDAHPDGGGGGGEYGLSKRKQKKLQRLTVAELKQLVRKPEVVEWTDVTSSDPRLLVHLKCTRNSVPIPPHWAQKRDYLQNKRGIEKPPYLLPHYIADTGIATIKDALKQKEADQSLKQKTRERVQPKMGKMDIDYQKLYDAFFKFQTKPTLSAYGDTYYEGKEFETKFKDRRPGVLSKELVEALSIPPLAPPPWLVAMQRFGPPPSYPHLQIPGLNAPIPEGAQWGFHPGGWGRPPVDEYGNPLYANVLGAAAEAVDPDLTDAVQKEHWGMLEPEEDDPDQEEAQEGQGAEEEDVDGSGLQSVQSSVGAGLETPSFVQLRKDARLEHDSQPAPPRSLYQVLPERTATSSSGQLMASERVYDLSSTTAASAAAAAASAGVLGAEASRGTKRTADAVEISLNPDELDTHGRDQAKLGARYDEERSAQANSRFKYAASDDAEGVAQVRQQMQSQRERDQQRERERQQRRH